MNHQCLFCFARAFEKLLDKHVQENEVKVRMAQRFFSMLGEADTSRPTPYIAREFHALIREYLDETDPYRREKEKGNQLALSLYPELEKKVKQSGDPFNRALRYALAGNIMDYGPSSRFDVHDTLEKVEKADFAIDHSRDLQEEIRKAKNILYIGDNAGEIVMDKLFLETIGHPNVHFAVRGQPVINDATMEDARVVGMDQVAEVISNGYDAPSTILEEASEEFMRAYLGADLIIAKGQGNFEGLMHQNDHRLWFLLMVKCQVIGDMLGVYKGDFVVSNGHQKDRG